MKIATDHHSPGCWLVLADEADECARWVAGGLSQIAEVSVAYVTDTDLVGALWTHYSLGDATTSLLELTDGRVLDARNVTATFNRLTHVPSQLVASLVEEDRLYGLQEMSALVLSWLASLEGTVINGPDVRGLSGAWRSSGEWALLATMVGLTPVPVLAGDITRCAAPGVAWHSSTPWNPFIDDVVVVGDEVFSNVELSRQEIESFRCLARESNAQLLGVMLAADGSKRVAGVTPLPDLRAGGDVMLRALSAALIGKGVDQ